MDGYDTHHPCVYQLNYVHSSAPGHHVLKFGSSTNMKSREKEYEEKVATGAYRDAKVDASAWQICKLKDRPQPFSDSLLFHRESEGPTCPGHASIISRRGGRERAILDAASFHLHRPPLAVGDALAGVDPHSLRLRLALLEVQRSHCARRPSTCTSNGTTARFGRLPVGHVRNSTGRKISSRAFW